MGTHSDATERKEHGTHEDKKAGGDAEAAAREGVKTLQASGETL